MIITFVNSATYIHMYLNHQPRRLETFRDLMTVVTLFYFFNTHLVNVILNIHPANAYNVPGPVWNLDIMGCIYYTLPSNRLAYLLWFCSVHGSTIFISCVLGKIIWGEDNGTYLLHNLCAQWSMYPTAKIFRGYPDRRTIAMRKHGGYGPFDWIPSIYVISNGTDSLQLTIWRKPTLTTIRSKTYASYCDLSYDHCEMEQFLEFFHSPAIFQVTPHRRGDLKASERLTNKKTVMISLNIYKKLGLL